MRQGKNSCTRPSKWLFTVRQRVINFLVLKNSWVSLMFSQPLKDKKNTHTPVQKFSSDNFGHCSVSQTSDTEWIFHSNSSFTLIFSRYFSYHRNCQKPSLTKIWHHWKECRSFNLETERELVFHAEFSRKCWVSLKNVKYLAALCELAIVPWSTSVHGLGAGALWAAVMEGGKGSLLGMVSVLEQGGNREKQNCRSIDEGQGGG